MLSSWSKRYNRLMPRSETADEATSEVVESERRKKLGQLGENAAVKALQKAGYRIIHRNYLCKSGEIDIIAEHRNAIVFVEVKTRSPRSWATPESAITPEKMARVRRAAEYYLSAFRKPSAVRFDVVTVLTTDNDRIDKVTIIADAFPVADAGSIIT